MKAWFCWFAWTRVCFVVSVEASDWPQILGPARNGVAAPIGAELLTAVPPDGARPRWKVEVGNGFAGPVVAGDACYLFHRLRNEAVLDCYDRKTGERRWRFGYATDYVDSFGFDEGPRSCPTVVGGRVFIYGAEGMLHAVDARTGDAIWERDLAKEFGAVKGFFGRCSSPLVAEGRVMLDIGGKLPDGKGANLIAFEAESGKLAWAADDGESDYASPGLMRLPSGEALAVFFTREGLAGVGVEDGRIRFRERFRSDINASVNAASPLVIGGKVFLSACYDVGCGLWEVSDGGMLVSVYKKQNALEAHFATPVPHEGYLYGFHGRQESGQSLRCLRLLDGKVMWEWRENSVPAGAVLLVNDRLLVLSEKGELLVAPADPEGFRPLFRAQVLGSECRALPAFADGFLFGRDKKQLVCVDLRSTEARGDRP